MSCADRPAAGSVPSCAFLVILVESDHGAGRAKRGPVLSNFQVTPGSYFINACNRPWLARWLSPLKTPQFLKSFSYFQWLCCATPPHHSLKGHVHEEVPDLQGLLLCFKMGRKSFSPTPWREGRGSVMPVMSLGRHHRHAKCSSPVGSSITRSYTDAPRRGAAPGTHVAAEQFLSRSRKDRLEVSLVVVAPGRAWHRHLSKLRRVIHCCYGISQVDFTALTQFVTSSFPATQKIQLSLT